MFRKDKWPFIPASLSEIIDKNTLSVIEAGCCERLGRAMTIIDGDNIGRIDSIKPKQRFEGFCNLLRDEQRVRGGNAACEGCDLQAAEKSLKLAHEKPYRTFHCHMGLLDATHVIEIQDRPVAVLFAGQYRPENGPDNITRNVRNLATNHNASIELLDTTVENDLISLAKNLPPSPENFQERLTHEAEHIKQIIEAEYRRKKSLWEQEFLDELRALGSYKGDINLQQVRQYTRHFLKFIYDFCRCDYVVFFASVREDDTVLAPIAEAGISETIRAELPHFNWKKAGLPVADTPAKDWTIAVQNEIVVKGIRGDNSHYFSQASCALPTHFGSRYRGVLVFGPFADPVNLVDENRFLQEITRTVGLYVLPELEVMNLQQERRRWESTAKLLIHQLRTTLTPITTRIGDVRYHIKQLPQDNITKEAGETLQRAENLCLQLGRSARETVEAHVMLLEPEDLDFERYPLSVLVANCVDGFASKAQKSNLDLVVDDSVELLPEAQVDVARMTIALSNVLENALKYSYAKTRIFLRSEVHLAGDLELAAAVIEVDNLGEEIRFEQQEAIFEQGTRGLTRAKMGRIPGTGLGLWEARAVVEAHGGKITVSCRPTAIHRRQGKAFRVIFSLRIPLRQAK